MLQCHCSYRDSRRKDADRNGNPITRREAGRLKTQACEELYSILRPRWARFPALERKAQ